MNFKYEEEGNLVIYTISGEVTVANNKEFAKRVDDDVQSGKTKFLIDLVNVVFMDSSSLGIISKILKNKRILKVIIDEKNESVKKMVELVILHFDKMGYFTDRKKAIEYIKSIW